MCCHMNACTQYIYYTYICFIFCGTHYLILILTVNFKLNFRISLMFALCLEIKRVNLCRHHCFYDELRVNLLRSQYSSQTKLYFPDQTTHQACFELRLHYYILSSSLLLIFWTGLSSWTLYSISKRHWQNLFHHISRLSQKFDEFDILLLWRRITIHINACIRQRICCDESFACLDRIHNLECLRTGFD